MCGVGRRKNTSFPSGNDCFDFQAGSRPASAVTGASTPRVLQERQIKGMPSLNENPSRCISLWLKAGFCLMAAGDD